MPEIDTVHRLLREAYEARKRGDKARLREFFAPGATFRMVGHAGLADRLPVQAVDATPVIDALVDQYAFDEVEIVHAVTDGKAAVIHMRITVSSRGESVSTEVCDIWDLDDAGRITAITEFLDTSLVAQFAVEAA
jgi:ketosteroid isomerase-like protein